MELGEMFLVGFRGNDIDKTSWIVETISKYRIGGVILFDRNMDGSRRNYSSPDELKALTTGLQALSDGLLFIAVDQEGGKVCRLKTKDGFLSSRSAAELSRLPAAEVRRETGAMAQMLKEHGINLNFAPVVDLDINTLNPVIGGLDRSYSDMPREVVKFAELFVAEHHHEGVACCLKHFPGHGSSETDSHVGFVDVTATWQKKELQPYREIIANGYCDGIMTGHLVHRTLDGQGLPATLSSPILDGLLRKQLHFNGVVFSDDLQMKAISAGWGYTRAVQKAVLAGVDVLVIGNNLDYQEEAVQEGIAAIDELLQKGLITRERIERSLHRIKTLKRKIQGEIPWKSASRPITC